MFKERITSKLIDAFKPTYLEVIDESHKHAGHGNFGEGNETHFQVIITADCFNGITRVNQHRMINNALSAELNEHVHALAIVVKA